VKKTNKFLAILTLVIGALYGTVGIAAAIDIPTLTWERGREQTVTLGGNTEAVFWDIRLTSSTGKTVSTFRRSSPNASKYYVYTADISNSLPVGKYTVIASGIASGIASSRNVALVNLIPLTHYSPLDNPRKSGGLAVAAFTLLALIAGKQIESQYGNADNSDNADNSNTSDNNAEVKTEDSAAHNVDTDYHGQALENRGPGDRLALGKSRTVSASDSSRYLVSFFLSARSHILARVYSDGSYLQALFGPLSYLSTIAGAVFGFMVASHSHLSSAIIPTSFVLMSALIVLGTVDALAGFVAAITFTGYAAIHGDITTIFDLRGAIGLSISWFTPALIANNIRPIRRTHKPGFAWERITDYIVGTIFGGFAVKGLVGALDGFTHHVNPISQHASTFGLIGASAILIRYLSEDFVAWFMPARLEYVSPRKLRERTQGFYYFALLLKIVAYLLFMFGFLGPTWQCFAAVVMLILPGFLGHLANEHQWVNFPKLYQFIPGGVPWIFISSLIGYATVSVITGLPILGPNKTQTIFIVNAIPGFLISLLKLFGRSAAEGDQRWYRRDSKKVFYRLAGPIFLIGALLATVGVIP
jgi:hypothetical protein